MHKNKFNLSKKILSWYDNNKRTLPWRISQNSKKKQYYRILSEFMLQQTQVKIVIPYFVRFVNKIPNLKFLSTSSEKKILKLWEGLGYYKRARNLRKTAKILVKDYDGRLPKKFEEIIKLPGIGEYTANALLALIYNKPYIPIDGNVKRFFSRFFFIYEREKEFDKKIANIKNKLFKTTRNADLAEALMDFGAVICKPKDPLCSECNLRKFCKFFKGKTKFSITKKYYTKEKRLNIYCCLNKYKKEIALSNNDSLSFLNNFKMPKTQIIDKNNNLISKRWNFLCNYKNNISNLRINISLFYKFTKKKPKKFQWYRIDKPGREFIPSFTKKIIKKVEKLYR